MADVEISVVIAAHNAKPLVTAALESVVGQSIGVDRLQVVAVDDGSTDGTGAELDRFAAEYPGFRVLHQEHSASAGRARNTGLEHATGRYVFFLDPGYRLGPEALERMLATAEANASDIVLDGAAGRAAREAGQDVAVSLLQRNQPRVGLYTSPVYWALDARKLFRRDFVDRLELRFPTRMAVEEDHPFTALAYLGARTISVVADYDCCVVADPGAAAEPALSAAGLRERREWLRMMLSLVADRVPVGPRRDHLMRRHFQLDLDRVLCGLFSEPDPEPLAEAFAEVREWVAVFCTKGVESGLSAAQRLRVHLIRRGLLDETIRSIAQQRSGRPTKEIVEAGRVYGAFPFFRDPDLAIPDQYYDITETLGVEQALTRLDWNGDRLRLSGYAYPHRVDTMDVVTELVLRERGRGDEVRLPATVTATPELTERDGRGLYDYGKAGFEVDVDPAVAAGGLALREGQWEFFLNVSAQGVTKEVRLAPPRAGVIPVQRRRRTIATETKRVVMAPYLDPSGALSLDVGGGMHAFAESVTVTSVGWGADPLDVVVRGRIQSGEQELGPIRLRLTDGRGRCHTLAVDRTATAEGEVFESHIPLTTCANGRPLGIGTWDLHLATGEPDASVEVPVYTTSAPCSVRWWRRGLPIRVRAVTVDGRIRLVVVPVEVLSAVWRRVLRKFC